MQGRRTPLVAGAVALVLAVLMIFFLVLPKLRQISVAREELQRAANEQETLETQLAALREAREQAPEAERIIQDVERQVPPTVDQAGIILLMRNAASSSTVDLTQLTPGDPTFDPTTGLSTIPVSIGLTGTYFEIAEFLFIIETLPRAAKVLTVSLAPGGGDDNVSTAVPTLTLTATAVMFTSDADAGPGSVPGETGAGEVPEGA